MQHQRSSSNHDGTQGILLPFPSETRAIGGPSYVEVMIQETVLEPSQTLKDCEQHFRPYINLSILLLLPMRMRMFAAGVIC